MSLTNEDLLLISQLLDNKLKPLKDDINDTKLILENDVLPRLQNIESCYTSTYKRYQSGINQIESMQTDIQILKKVVSEHSEKLQKLA
jgi:hypothetical protein